jgi:ATP-dependent Clp protease ATP-binding subunit ClpC
VQPNPKWPGVFARQLFAGADEQARRLGHNYTGTEHMLLALLEAHDEIAFHALTALGITSAAVRAKIKDAVGIRGPRQWKSLGIRPELKQALDLSQREARRFGHSKPSSQHFLLGLIRVEDSLAVQILAELGADPRQIRAQLSEMLDISARELETKPGRRSARLTPR